VSESGLIGVIKTLGSFAAGTMPGLVQLRADNTDPFIDCSVVPLHIPFQTAELKKSEDKPLHGMILLVIIGLFVSFPSQLNVVFGAEGKFATGYEEPFLRPPSL
jgi:hypothetical protein